MKFSTSILLIGAANAGASPTRSSTTSFPKYSTLATVASSDKDGNSAIKSATFTAGKGLYACVRNDFAAVHQQKVKAGADEKAKVTLEAQGSTTRTFWAHDTKFIGIADFAA